MFKSMKEVKAELGLSTDTIRYYERWACSRWRVMSGAIGALTSRRWPGFR